MIRFIRDLRLVPIAVLASACLLALKAVDLVLDRSLPVAAETRAPVDADATVIRVAPGVPRPSDPQRSWAQQMFNFPDASGASPASDQTPLPSIVPLIADKGSGDIITGSVGDNNAGNDKSETKAKDEGAGTAGKDGKAANSDNDGKPANADKDSKPANADKDSKPADAGKDNKPANADKDKPANAGKNSPNAAPPSATVIKSEGAPMPSNAERAILERLQQRRQELDKRARELDIREGLLAEAEKRIEAHLAEIKQDQAQLVTAAEKKDEAGAARLKGLVTMYENMKARDAAKIFDRLDSSVLIEVVSQINPRRMSDILAQMSPETAERLTVELANRAKTVTKDGASELPKIEGRPTSQ